jgi:cytochrome c-type biogenesis protein CcmE
VPRAARVLLSLAIAGGAVALLVYSSLAEADYFKHVHEVTLDPDRWVDRRLRVHGEVEPGSIDERIVGQSTVRDFVLRYEGQRLRVHHQGTRPDTFRDLAEVVATGTLVAGAGGLQLRATEITAKCPSRYTARGGRAFEPGGSAFSP